MYAVDLNQDASPIPQAKAGRLLKQATTPRLVQVGTHLTEWFRWPQALDEMEQEVV